MVMSVFKAKLILIVLILTPSVWADKPPISIVCPCSLEVVNQTLGKATFSIAFHRQADESGPLKLELRARDINDSFVSGEYTRLGKTSISSLSYNSSSQPVTAFIPLSIGTVNKYISLVLETDDSEYLPIDQVPLTERPYNYSNPGGSIFSATSKIMFQSAVDFQHNGENFLLRIPTVINDSLTSTNDSLLMKIAVIDDNNEGFYVASEALNIFYDSDGFSSIDVSGQLSQPLSAYAEYQNVYLWLERGGERIVQYLLVDGATQKPGIFTTTFTHIDTLLDSDSDGMADFNERLIGSQVDEQNAFSATVIEMAFTYGDSAQNSSSGGVNLTANLAHYIAVSNRVFSDSGVNITLQNVGQYRVGDDSNLSTDNVLNDLGGREGVFLGLDAAVTVKPDLLFHVSTMDSLNGKVVGSGDSYTAGIARLQGVSNDGVIDYESSYTLGNNLGAIVIDDGDALTLTHEVGHLMGLAHARVQYDTIPPGAFPWSVGYGVDDDFSTIMAYPQEFGAASKVGLFSSPALNCNEVQCGVSRINLLAGADAVSSLKSVALQISGISNGFNVWFSRSGSDSDADGVSNSIDPFPTDASEWLDTDEDGIGNNADMDDDGDGIGDSYDSFPLDSTRSEDAEAVIDVAPPELISISVDKTSVDVTNDNQAVLFTIIAADSSGIDWNDNWDTQLVLRNTNSGKYRYARPSPQNPGVYTLNLGPTDPVGPLEISFLRLKDIVGNRGTNFYSHDNEINKSLRSFGLPPSIEVIGGTESDPPSLEAIEVDKIVVDTTEQIQLVSFKISVVDASGIDWSADFYRSITLKHKVTGEYLYAQTSLESPGILTLILDPALPSGELEILWLRLEDKLGNRAIHYYDVEVNSRKTLKSLGLPASVLILESGQTAPDITIYPKVSIPKTAKDTAFIYSIIVHNESEMAVDDLTFTIDSNNIRLDRITSNFGSFSCSIETINFDSLASCQIGFIEAAETRQIDLYFSPGDFSNGSFKAEITSDLPDISYLNNTLTSTINIVDDVDDDGITDDLDTFPNDPSESLDTDKDGVGNNADTDDDGDGISDTQETVDGTNPLLSDTDGDGLTDGQEVTNGTNPLLSDTDGDGFSDEFEVSMGADPLDGDSIPRSGLNILLIKGALDIKKAKEESCAESDCANNE